MKIIPAIDIIGGKTVRLEQGKYERKLSYDVSPVDAAREWEAAGAELLHVVDLDGAKEGHPVNLDVVKEIVKAVNVPVEVGGGFRKELDIKDALDHGVWRVIVGSKAFEDIDFARNCVPTDLAKDLLESFAKKMGMNLHVEIGGSGDTHHCLEAAFKALGVALDKATRIDPRRAGEVPSSKGIL